MKKILFLGLVFFSAMAVQSQPALPTKAQLDWHEQEFYLFVHFGPNTFTGEEWGHGDERPEIFNPTSFDCRQWAKTAKEAGATGIIITAKHHDGFCLWPSNYSTHTVRESQWRNGQGDVLKELSEACKEYGINFGVYISPWDRNHPDYGTDKYNDVFVNMMEEIFTSYGPIYELWWDGANGEGPNGKKQEYDWERFKETVRRLSPNTVVFSDVGPDIRWVGNESGIAGKTNWNYLNIDGFTAGLGAPPTDTLTRGNEWGNYWIPAEADVSIRPGWFYHAKEDDKVKTPEQLFQLYLKSVGRGANLLLNVPPDQRGLFHEKDVESLKQFGKLIWKNQMRSTLPSVAEEHSNRIVRKMNTTTLVNAIILQEDIANGQFIKKFQLEIKKNGNSNPTIIEGTTIGRKRILTFPTVAADEIVLTILESNGPIRLKGGLLPLKIDEHLIEKD